MRRPLALVAAATAALLAIASCSSAGGDAGDGSGSTQGDQQTTNGSAPGSDAGAKPFAGQTLTVLNYKAFGSDSDYAVKGFEELTGATVEHVYHSGAAELRQILRTGGIGHIDVLEPNTTFIQQLAEEDLIQPLDPDRIPNLSKAQPAFLDNEGLHYDGQLYGAPVVWGTTPMFINTDKIADKPADWSALWDPQYKKRVTIRDNAENAITIAALYLGQDPFHPDDLDSIEKALKELQPQVLSYWNSEDDFVRSVDTDLVDIGYAWGSSIAKAAGSGDPVTYVVPDGGVVGWLDGWSIAKDAPHPDLAYAWIDWMLSTKFQTQWADDPALSAPASANSEVPDQITDEAKERIPSYSIDPKDVLVGQPITPEQQQQYQDLWTRVKAQG